jgi:hypothetical protein
MALLLKESNDMLPNYYFHPVSFYQQSNLKYHSSMFDHREAAARILFDAIHWIKTVPAFLSLSNTDQVRIIFNVIIDRHGFVFVVVLVESS